MKREHPVKILRYCALNLWLLLFPLLRTIKLYPLSPEAILSWLYGAWFDILVILYMIGLAVIKWANLTYSFDKKHLYIHKGIVFRKEIIIPYGKITAVHESDIKIPFMLNLSMLRIDTRAGDALGELSLWLRKSRSHEISSAIPLCTRDDKFHFRYSISIRRILLYSFLFSSSLSGTIYVAAFFLEAGRGTGKVLRRLHVAEAIEKMSSVASSVFYAVPKIVITIFIILLSCRFLSFIVNLIRNIGFRTDISNERVRITSGIVPLHRTCIHYPYKETTVLKQGLLSRLTKRASLFVTYPSCHKKQNGSTLLVPIVRTNSSVIPFFMQKIPDKHYPYKGAWFSFLWQPAGLTGLILTAIIHISYIQTISFDLIYPLLCIMLIPASAFLIVRLISRRRQYFSWDDKNITMRYSKKLTIMTVTAQRENIAFERITSTRRSRKHGFCALTVHIKGGTKAVLRGIKTDMDYL